MKSSRPIKDVCVRKCRRPNSYYLGSAESPTSDSFSVRLKSSLSDGVASPPCNPQVGSALRTAQLIWAASLPYCTGLLYRHDLPEYSHPVKCSRPQIFPPITFEPLNRGRPHFRPQILKITYFGNGECVGGGGGGLDKRYSPCAACDTQ